MPNDLRYRNKIIGQLPPGWGKAKVDHNLVDILGGFSCAKRFALSSGVPHLRPMNITTSGEVIITDDTVYIPHDFQENIENYYLQKWDVLYNNTNSVELVGKTGLVREFLPAAFSNHLNRLRVRDPEYIDPRWLALALRNLQAQGFFAANCNKWIGQAGFSVSELAEVEIPLPDIRVQRRIVARIEALLSEVREMRELNEDIIGDTNKLKSSVLSEVFPDPDKPLLAGWQLMLVEDISNPPQYGYTQSARWEPVGPKFLRISDIQDASVNWTTVPYCECDQVNLERYRLRDGDIVFARSGSVGKTFLVKNPPVAVFASYLIRLQIIQYASPDFVFWFFQSPYYWKQIIPRGASQPNMNAQLLKKIKLPIPDSEIVQKRIVEYISSIYSDLSEIRREQVETRTLISDMEQAILAQAFRGEL